jgi:hypothetical protein
VDLGRWDNDELDLYRMAEDGIAAREAVERVRALAREQIDHPQGDACDTLAWLIVRALDAAPEAES